jgi:hypothetical protein
VDPATAQMLAAAFLEIEADESLKASVLWGAGGTFCAGADLKAVASGWDPTRDRAPSGAADDAFGPMGPTRLVLEKPVIAAISGHAVAGGLELALWCDLRVMEDGAVLGVFCRRWGVPLIDGGTVRLPRIIGQWYRWARLVPLARRSRRKSPPSRRAACGRTVDPRTVSGASTKPRPSPASTPAGGPCSRAANRPRGRHGSSAAPAAVAVRLEGTYGPDASVEGIDAGCRTVRTARLRSISGQE